MKRLPPEVWWGSALLAVLVSLTVTCCLAAGSEHALTPTDADPTPGVRVPSGDLYVWDPVVRELRNVSVEPPVSPVQALRNFQVAHARYRWQVFKDGELTAEGCHPTMAQLRRVLRSVLIDALRERSVAGVQYNCWDFIDQTWLDPTTGVRKPAGSDGLHNAELQLKGGFGDLL